MTRKIGEESVDTSIFTRTYFAPMPSRAWPAQLPSPAWLYGPVKVLDSAGNLVKTLSVEELHARPPQPWEPKQPGFERIGDTRPNHRRRKFESRVKFD